VVLGPPTNKRGEYGFSALPNTANRVLGRRPGNQVVNTFAQHITSAGTNRSSKIKNSDGVHDRGGFEGFLLVILLF